MVASDSSFGPEAVLEIIVQEAASHRGHGLLGKLAGLDPAGPGTAGFMLYGNNEARSWVK